MIKIIFADDHDLIREGLKKVLSYESDFIILDDKRDGNEIIERLKDKSMEKPDIVLLDINMESMNGIEALKIIKTNFSDIKVIMLTVENQKRKISEAMEVGADGYVLKESAGSEITNAIRTVYAGGKYIDKSLINMFVLNDRKQVSKVNSKFDLLTEKEVIILMEISKGLKNKEIGNKLFLSEKTIKNYVTKIFKKIKVEDRVQATLYAINNNITEYIDNIDLHI